MLDARVWGPLKSLLDENLGQLFPTRRSDTTSPRTEAEGGLGFPVPEALPTRSMLKAVPLPVLLAKDIKHLEPLNRLHTRSQPPALPPHPRTPALSD